MWNFFRKRAFSRRVNQNVFNFTDLNDLFFIMRYCCSLRFGAMVRRMVSKFNPSLRLRPISFKADVKPQGNKPMFMLAGVTFQFLNTDGVDDDELQETVASSKDLLESFNGSQSSISSYLAKDDWEPVIIRDTFQVWRKCAGNRSLYQYKIFGSFKDISAQEFFTIQKDLEYRKTWDHLVIKLDIVEADKERPMSSHDNVIDYGNEVIHWIMHYPFPMYSREYCLVRRAVVDFEEKAMVLVSRAVEHPSCPPSDEYVRVTDYKSEMVICPHHSFNENGFDFVLTYFDDPKAAFPGPAYNWMAASGVPEFVETLHKAALRLKNSRNRKDNSCSFGEESNSFGNLYRSYLNLNYRTQEEKT